MENHQLAKGEKFEGMVRDGGGGGRIENICFETETVDDNSSDKNASEIRSKLIK